MQVLKQAWWAPVAAVLALAQAWVGLAFIYGEGTSNILDAESTVAGISLAFGGAAALIAGLWMRPQARGLGNTLLVIGAALGAIWFWTVAMTPLAVVVIVGVAVSQVRSPATAAEAS
jgi:succinate-acetate transporter protein